MPDWMEHPTMSGATFQVPESSWLQLYQSVTPHPLGGLRFHNDHASHEVVPEGSLGGSPPSSDAIRGSIECAQQFETLELGNHEVNSDVLVDPKPRKCTKKRDRDKNWTDEETSVLVKWKALAFHDKASPFRKQKSSSTDWEAISKELRNNHGTSVSERTWDQCRARWDTLVKSHRKIKERCMQTGKQYAELTEEEISGLKLATTLKKEWYEIIDGISRKTRTQKPDNPARGVDDLTYPVGGIGNDADPLSPRIPPTYQGSPPLLLERLSSSSAGISPPCSPPLDLSTGRPEPGTSSPKQIAIPGFSRLPGQLRSTLLDLILGSRFLRGSREYTPLSYCCLWLSIVQNRALSDIYDDVSELLKMGLVRVSADFRPSSLDASYFRVFDKFVKKVIRNNPSCDTHSYFKLLDDTKFMSAREFSLPEQIRVLKLDGCRGLESIDFKGLGRLRSLFITVCPVLKEVTGWKFLRELAWLEIANCPSFHVYPDLQYLPSLKEFSINEFDASDCSPRSDVSDCPARTVLDISQCVRLRTLTICGDDLLEESGNLSSQKCLEVLGFIKCYAFTSVDLSGLHSLQRLCLAACAALSRLPDLSHMKELVHIDVSETALEVIPGVENLVGLEHLNCRHSKLKHRTDLHHLPALREGLLHGTPLIEDDPSSFYFDKGEVQFNRQETRHVDVSDVSDTEHSLSDSFDEEDEEADEESI